MLAMYDPAGILFIMKCQTQMLEAAKASESYDFSGVHPYFVNE
jgi:hypothetical protein